MSIPSTSSSSAAAANKTAASVKRSDEYKYNAVAAETKSSAADQPRQRRRQDGTKVHQKVALAYTYLRIARCVVAAPKYVFLAALAFKIGFRVLVSLTSRCSSVALVSTAAVALAAQHGAAQRFLSSTSNSDAIRAFFETNLVVRLPVVAAVLLSVAVQRWVGPLLLADTAAASSSDGSFVSLWQSIRLGFALLLAGSSVAARYVGRHSVMRCSCAPLAENPVDAKRRQFWDNLWLSDFPQSLVSPSDRVGELFSFSRPTTTTAMPASGPFLFSPPEAEADMPVVSSPSSPPLSAPTAAFGTGGTRFVHATYLSMLAQTIISVVVGVALGYGAAYGWFPAPVRGYYAYRESIVLPTILTFMFAVGLPLYSTVYTAHEIDPKTYENVSVIDSMLAFLQSMTQSPRPSTAFLQLFVTVVLIPSGIACASVQIVGGYDWRLSFQLAASSGLLSLYLYCLDEGIKHALFSPAPDLERLIEEYGDGDDETMLPTRRDVIMYSILFGESAAVEMLSDMNYCSSQGRNSQIVQVGILGVEQEECRRVKACSKLLASTVILRRTRPVVEAPLEEDVLRVAILRSIGRSTDSSLVDGLVHPKFPAAGEGKSLSLPLVRSLCAFVHTTGEVLSDISRGSERNRIAPVAISRNVWALPPGLFVCAEDAVHSISWCIVRGMTSPYTGNRLPDWKSSTLSVLVPAALSSIFCLREGIVAFEALQRQRASRDGEARVGRAESDRAKHHHNVCQSFSPIVDVCDKTALKILSYLKLPQGIGSVSLGLDENCSLWVKQLLSKSPPMVADLPTR